MEDFIYFNEEWNGKPKQENNTSEFIWYIWDMSRKREYPTKEEYRQLGCRCNVPRPNSFTGNCTNCNLIIKPIR